jgi:hypothetical protein
MAAVCKNRPLYLTSNHRPLDQSDASGLGHGLRTGMADMSAVRDAYTLTVLERLFGDPLPDWLQRDCLT